MSLEAKEFLEFCGKKNSGQQAQRCIGARGFVMCEYPALNVLGFFAGWLDSEGKRKWYHVVYLFLIMGTCTTAATLSWISAATMIQERSSFGSIIDIISAIFSIVFPLILWRMFLRGQVTDLIGLASACNPKRTKLATWLCALGTVLLVVGWTVEEYIFRCSFEPKMGTCNAGMVFHLIITGVTIFPMPFVLVLTSDCLVSLGQKWKYATRTMLLGGMIEEEDMIVVMEQKSTSRLVTSGDDMGDYQPPKQMHPLMFVKAMRAHRYVTTTAASCVRSFAVPVIIKILIDVSLGLMVALEAMMLVVSTADALFLSLKVIFFGCLFITPLARVTSKLRSLSYELAADAPTAHFIATEVAAGQKVHSLIDSLLNYLDSSSTGVGAFVFGIEITYPLLGQFLALEYALCAAIWGTHT